MNIRHPNHAEFEEKELAAQAEARQAASDAVTFDEWLEAATKASALDKAMFMDRLFKNSDEARRVLHKIGETILETAIREVMQRQADDIARNAGPF